MSYFRIQHPNYFCHQPSEKYLKSKFQTCRYLKTIFIFSFIVGCTEVYKNSKFRSLKLFSASLIDWIWVQTVIQIETLCLCLGSFPYADRVMSLPDDASGMLCKLESLWGRASGKPQVVASWSRVWGTWQLVRRAQVQEKGHSGRFPTAFLKGISIPHMSALEYLGAVHSHGNESNPSSVSCKLGLFRAWLLKDPQSVPRHTHQNPGSRWTPLRSGCLPWAHCGNWGEWE